MMGMGIPLSSLKRDEIYTFMGGLYIALSWAIYSLVAHPFDVTNMKFLLAAALLFMWLSSVIILFVLLILFYLFIEKAMVYFTKKKDIVYFRRIMQLGDPIVNYYDYEFLDKLRSIIHTSSVIIISISISLYPIIGIVSRILKLTDYSYCVTTYLIILLVLFYRVYRTTLMRLAFVKLISVGEVEYIDYKKYSEETAKHIAGVRIENTQSRIKSYLSGVKK